MTSLYNVAGRVLGQKNHGEISGRVSGEILEVSAA